MWSWWRVLFQNELETKFKLAHGVGSLCILCVFLCSFVVQCVGLFHVILFVCLMWFFFLNFIVVGCTTNIHGYKKSSWVYRIFNIIKVANQLIHRQIHQINKWRCYWSRHTSDTHLRKKKSSIRMCGVFDYLFCIIVRKQKIENPKT